MLIFEARASDHDLLHSSLKNGMREKQWSKLTNEDQTAFYRPRGRVPRPLTQRFGCHYDPKIVASGKIAKSTPE